MLDMNCMIEVLTHLGWIQNEYINNFFERGNARFSIHEELNVAGLYYFGSQVTLYKGFKLPEFKNDKFNHDYYDFAYMISENIGSFRSYDEIYNKSPEWVLGDCEKEGIVIVPVNSDENEKKEENMSQKKEYAIVMKCQCCGEWTLMCAEDKGGNNGILVFDDPFEAEQHALQFYELGDFWIGEDVGDGFEDVKGMKCNDIAREKYENE